MKKNQGNHLSAISTWIHFVSDYAIGIHKHAKYWQARKHCVFMFKISSAHHSGVRSLATVIKFMFVINVNKCSELLLPEWISVSWIRPCFFCARLRECVLVSVLYVCEWSLSPSLSVSVNESEITDCLCSVNIATPGSGGWRK